MPTQSSATVQRGTRGSRIDRETFLRAAGLRQLTSPAQLLERRRSAQDTWDREVDVVIVGSGGAAYAAACAASHAGAAVVMLERSAIYGGTTRSAGGVVHIYNNAVMQAEDLADPREDALKYMARSAYPALYHPDHPTLGLPELEYCLIAAFYDEGAAVMQTLTELGAVDMTSSWRRWDNEHYPDYNLLYAENKAPRGRGLKARAPDGSTGDGVEIIRQMKAFADQRSVELLLRHRVLDVVSNADASVVGVLAEDADGRIVAVRARKGVIFGSGGFAHNADMRRHYLRGPVAGGCGWAGNTGDFVTIGGRVGARSGVMNHAAWAQDVYEHAGDDRNGNIDVFNIPGDSVVLVNKYGRRVVNEKREYQERGTAHHVWLNNEYPNYLLFMVYDQRTAELFAGRYPIPPADTIAPYVVKGQTLRELLDALDQRLADYGRTPPGEVGVGGVRIDPHADDNLAETIRGFNALAESGVDPEFHRGETGIELSFHGPPMADNKTPNPTMYPLSPVGPYYAIMLIGVAIDTRAGPMTNAHGQVLDTTGAPIPGLYGAGNCVANVFGQAYPGGGSTIGPAMVFGYLAGRHAASSPITPLDRVAQTTATV